MDKSTVVALTAIALCAVLAPVLADLLKRTRIPEVVILLVLGIIIGPQVSNVATSNLFIAGLAELGLAFLMFLAGYEIDLQRIKGRPLALAATGWVISVLLALGIAAIFVSTGEALNTMVLGIALTTTALGTLLPILSDAGLLPTALGTHVLAIGTMGEFGPIIAISVLLTPTRHDLAFVLLIAFVVIAVGAAVIATRSRPPRLIDLAQRHLETSSQFPIRVSFLLIMVLVLLATDLKLDILMGSFSAGLVFRLMIDEDETRTVHRKLEAIGYGFLIPVFFVVSGMRFDFRALFSTPSSLLRVPLFLGLFLVVRGLPALVLYRRDVGAHARAALALFSSTALPLVVVITDLGVSTGRMRPVNAAALVAAAIISVLVFPLLGLAFDGRQRKGALEADPGQIAST